MAVGSRMKSNWVARLPIMCMLVALPWLTWLPWWGYRVAGEAAREVPLFLFTACGLVALGLWLMTRDLFLGAFVAYLAVRAIVTPTALALATAHWVALGATVLVLVTDWPDRWRTGLRWALVASGVLESGYIVLQAWGMDPLWTRSGWILQAAGIHGTLDHPTLTAAMLAILTPLAPAWLLPIFGVGLFFTHSLLATLAALLGLVVTYRRHVSTWLMTTGVLVILTGTAFVFRLKSHDSYHERVFAWTTALRVMDHNWLAMLFGFGPGGWYRVVPQAQVTAQPGRTEVFYQGHNELLQLGFEGGLVALACLVGWCLWHRRALAGSGSVWALGLLCLGTFPFHIAPTALTAVAVVALTVARPKPEAARGWVEPPSPAPASWKYWQ